MNHFSTKIIKTIIYSSLFFLVYTKNHLAISKTKANAKFLSITTKHFEIIFRQEVMDRAKLIASKIEFYYPYTNQSLNIKHKKIPIFIQNKTVEVNSSTMMEPPMVLFQPQYPQIRNINGICQWEDILSIHEFRHVRQNLISHDSKWGRFIRFLTTGVPWSTIPGWLSEGDAVVTETLFTSGGRGRMPEFSMELKALILEKNYNYDQFFFESKNDNIPNHYVYGYFLVTYLKRKYGVDIIEKILKRQVSFPYIFLPFNLTVKKETGKYLSTIHKEMIKELRYLWKKQLSSIKITPCEIINKKNKKYTKYILPHLDENNKIIALKYGHKSLSKFISIDPKTKKEKTLKHVSLNSDIFSYSNKKITWIQLISNPTDFSYTYGILKIFDIKTGKIKTLSKKSRYSAPSLNKDGSKIVLVEADLAFNLQLLIIDSENGKILQKVKLNTNGNFIKPKWIDDENIILVLQNKDSKNYRYGNTLIIKNIKTGKENIFERTSIFIDNQYYYENKIFFNSNYNGISNIYCYNLKTKKTYQITSRKFGAFNPIVYKDKITNKLMLLFSDYSYSGMSIASMELDISKWIPINKVKNVSIKYYKPLLNKEGKDLTALKIPDYNFEVKKYNRFKNLFHFYSFNFWPLNHVSNFEIFSNKITVKAKDPLDTYELEFEYNHKFPLKKFYLIHKNQHIFSISYIYKKIFPNIGINISKGINDQMGIPKNFGKIPFDNPYLIFSPHINFIIPYYILENYQSIVMINQGYSFLFNYRNGKFKHYELNLFNIKITNTKISKYKKDVLPRWEQNFIYTKSMPSDFNKNILLPTECCDSFALLIVTPGIIKNHSMEFILSGYYDKAQRNRPPTKPPYAIVAGTHLGIQKPFLYRSRISNKILDFYFIYSFPLVYPDLKIGAFFYFELIRFKFLANYYIDFNYEDKRGGHMPYFNLAGFSILCDLKFLRMRNFKISLGAAFLYSKNNEFIKLKTDLLPFGLFPYPIIEMEFTNE